MSEKKKSGQFVVPGDRLGVIEEFIPSSGTYVKDGLVSSNVVGRMLMDLMNKRVSVYSLVRNVTVPRVGNTVTGNVMGVQDSSAAIRIFKIGTRQLSGVFNGVLHVSDTSFGYVESMFDVCRLGDIIRVQVISDKNGTYHLSTKGEDLGVIYGFCTRCGALLARKKAKMICDDCGNTERRKTAPDYGEAVI